ncbi:MAG: cadherin domain-containing protein, partial [Nostoc sp.]
MATLKTISIAGAQTIVTGLGATTVTATSGAGALNIKGVGLNSVVAFTTGAGEQTIGDNSGNGANLVQVTAISSGGAQTITSTSTSEVEVDATSTAGKQIITTGSGADIVTASTGSAINTINTGDGDDRVTILDTALGSYTIDGGAGDDTLTGGPGNDSLIGGAGADILDGVAGNNHKGKGKGEIDTLMGGAGPDLYILANTTSIYYDDGDSNTTGDKDYALIVGFNAQEDKDQVQLIGSSDQYSLEIIGSNTNLSIDKPGSEPELIAIFQNTTGLDLTSNTFKYFKNNAPTDLSLSKTTVDENVLAKTVIGKFSSTDPDTGNTFTYRLVNGAGGTDNSAFTIKDDELQINTSPDFEKKSSYNILVQTEDNGGLTFEKQLTINIKDVNEPPTDLALSANTVNENVPANTVIGTFSSTDPDTGNTFTYSLVAGTGDTDNSAFTINGDKLQINTSPDFENKSSYNILVQTQDNGGLTFQKPLTITIKDVNEAPTDLALNKTDVNENVPANTVIGTFSSTDPDQNDNFAYSLVSGIDDTDNNAFTIDGNTLKINNSPDFKTKASYQIRVRTTDNGNLTFEKGLTINVNDEIPSRLSNPDDDVFNITGQDVKTTLEVKLTGQNSQLVNELGLFTVD